MASAATLILGEGAAKKLHSLLFRIHDIELIFGVTDDSIAFGQQISKIKKVSVVYVGEADSAQAIMIRQMGAVICTEAWANDPDEILLKHFSIHAGKDKLYLDALSEDVDANLTYVIKLLKLLKKEKIKPEQTELILLGQSELDGVDLQATKKHYGYGIVKAFDQGELLSRLLLQKYPICDVISFDTYGKAMSDVDVLLVGFGKTGQEILRKLVANGQFFGSEFHAKVFDPNCNDMDGFFRMHYSSMLSTYDISFDDHSAQSKEMYEYLESHAESLRYIVVSVGDIKLGREIARDIMGILFEFGKELPVYQCFGDSVICYKRGGTQRWSLHDADILYGGTMDDFAKEINYFYNNKIRTQDDLWLECQYFDRMSCRASADYLFSLFERLDLGNIDELPADLMDTLARSEHLRWCAFHYSMEYEHMDEKCWDERALLYLKDIAEKGKSDIRISKDSTSKQHACLVGWDELDILSKKENDVTGGKIDYKRMDYDNIIAVFDIYKSNRV